MDNLLKCGHPIECFNLEDDYCGWCADIERLREENDSLRAQLRKDAVIVGGGEFYFDGDEIGLLEIRGGTVYLGAGRCNQVISRVEYGERET